jgi:hypothetical protein
MLYNTDTEDSGKKLGRFPGEVRNLASEVEGGALNEASPVRNRAYRIWRARLKTAPTEN